MHETIAADPYPRPKDMPPWLVRFCPECGSGDVRWCSISVRPYCAECLFWSPVNYRTAADAAVQWNNCLIKVGVIETF